MLLKLERDRLKKLISEAVLLLCKNSCTAGMQKLSVEGIIGITFDEEVVLVSFKDDTTISSLGQSRPSQILRAGSTSDSDAKKRLPQPVEEEIASPVMKEQIGAIGISEPSIQAGVSKRRQLDSSRDQSKKSSTVNPLPGNNSVSDRHLRSSSSNERMADSDIVTGVKSKISESNIDESCLESDTEVVKHSASELSSNLDFQQALETDNREITENRQNPSISKQPIYEKDNMASLDDMDSNFPIKCEENNADDDDDCVFIKSEIFELDGNNAFEFVYNDLSQGIMSSDRMVDEETFIDSNCVQYSQSEDFGVECISPQARPNRPFTRSSVKSQHSGYVQRAWLQQASPSAQIAEDPNIRLSRGSQRDDSIECHICRTVFKSRQTLNDHIQGTHLSRYRYKCLYCGRGFKWRSMLSSHRKNCSRVSAWIPKITEVNSFEGNY